jgi:arylsulfatase A-like enzyme
MSDNGAPKQVALNKPLRGHKLTPYEGGVRVPMIVKWPGVSTAGSVCNQYVMIDDVFPSFLEMAGVPLTNTDLDGKSWAPLVKGESIESEDRAIFWHFPHTYDQYPYSSIRQGKWKLIYLHTDRTIELYDLTEDISEEQNLASQHPEVVKELAERLTNYLKEADAGMPLDKQTGKVVEYPTEIIM